MQLQMHAFGADCVEIEAVLLASAIRETELDAVIQPLLTVRLMSPKHSEAQGGWISHWQALQRGVSNRD